MQRQLIWMMTSLCDLLLAFRLNFRQADLSYMSQQAAFGSKKAPQPNRRNTALVMACSLPRRYTTSTQLIYSGPLAD
jgi:hypothetical protein